MVASVLKCNHVLQLYPKASSRLATDIRPSLARADALYCRTRGVAGMDTHRVVSHSTLTQLHNLAATKSASCTDGLKLTTN